jgi:hypothetical protein
VDVRRMMSSYRNSAIRADGQRTRQHAEEQLNPQSHSICDVTKSAAGDRAENDEGLARGEDGLGERRVGALVREVFLAGEVAYERSALEGVVIADGAAEHRVPGFERVEGGTNGRRRGDFERNLSVHARKIAKVGGQYDADFRWQGHDG